MNASELMYKVNNINLVELTDKFNSIDRLDAMEQSANLEGLIAATYHEAYNNAVDADDLMAYLHHLKDYIQKSFKTLIALTPDRWHVYIANYWITLERLYVLNAAYVDMNSRTEKIKYLQEVNSTISYFIYGVVLLMKVENKNTKFIDIDE